MIELAIVEAMEERLLGLVERIGELDERIASELFNWQVEDMNRRYPHVERTGEESKTSVWPRSRLNTPRRRAIHRAKQARRIAPTVRAPVRRSKRPILRPVLAERLRQRMAQLGRQTFEWE